MPPSYLQQSIVVGENIYQPVRTEHYNNLYDRKDRIIQMEKTQTNLKQAIIQTEVALKSSYMNYRQSILSATFQTQKKQFENFLKQFKTLDSHERRPYETMFRKFKQKVAQHLEEIRMATKEPEQHTKQLQSLRQVWFQNQQIEQEEWKFILRGCLGISGAFLFHILIGANSRWGIINIYVTSFFKITTDPHIQSKTNTFVSPLTMLCLGLTMKWGFTLCNRFGPIYIMAICLLGLTGSVLAASFVDEFLQFIAFNNVLYGLFAGAVFISPIKQCHKYFPKHRLICNSIILVGTGIGSVLFGVLNTSCMNPKNQKALDSGYFAGDVDYVARNLPVCEIQMSIIVLVIGILGLICFFPIASYNRKQQQIRLQKGEIADFQNSCYTDEQAIKSQIFWVLAAIIVCCSLGNYYMLANFKNIVKTQKDPVMKTQQYLDEVLLTGAIIGAIFRLIWGLLFPVIGFKFTFILAVCVDLIVYSLFIAIELTQANYIILFAMHSIAQGGYAVIFPNTCLLLFGDIIGQSVYGFYWGFFSLTSFLQYLISVKIIQISDFVRYKINPNWVPENIYKIVFVPFIILAILSIVLCVVKKFQGRWQNSLKLLGLKCE